MRVLVCRTCRKLEELPDWVGHPDDDVYLNYVVGDHPDHQGQLFRLPIGVWMIESARDELVKQMMGHNEGLAAFDPSFYEVRNTFREDAITCYKGHGKPKGGCPDFNSEKKELRPATVAERREAGMSTRQLPVIHLCSFCPVRMHYEFKQNEANDV
jgi:hypothetical protein